MTSEELYKRLLDFAIKCQKLIKKLSYSIYNKEYSEQIIRSSASPGANYIEAIEASSRKDFIHRLKICRKEAKESIHWLTLIQNANETSTPIHNEIKVLTEEALELIKIFTASILTAEKNQKNSK